MIKNKAEFTGLELAAIIGEDSCINMDSSLKIKGITIDSRLVEKGNAFAAIKGERVDGHDKIKESFEKGATVAIAEMQWYESNKSEIQGKPVIAVDNVIETLGKLARFHRSRFECPVIAIAGSNGKTTTKNLMAHLLSQKYNVLKTYENFNNQIGTPLVLFAMDKSYDLAVIEIGTNEPGEIAILSQIVAPTHGLITNIGAEHLEKLKSIEGVELEETFLFGHLKKYGGWCFLNTDDQRLAKYIPVIDKALTFGQKEDADVQGKIEMNESINPVITLKYADREFSARMKTIGIATGLNAVAAAAAAFHFELSDEQIKISLETFVPEKNHGYARMLLENRDGIAVINDTYNSNPPSLKIALDTFNKYPASGKKYAALGDMRELGSSTEPEHINAIKYASDICDEVMLFGKDFKKAFDTFKNINNAVHFDIKENLIDYLNKKLNTGDAVLFKGSRGLKMEEAAGKIGLSKK